MNLLQLQSGYKAYGAKALFTDATFAINQGEHVGVVGPNGAGKTTLFKIITGQEDLDHGDLVRSKSLKIGYLEQEATWNPDFTLEDYLAPCSIPLWDLKQLGLDLGLKEEFFSKPLMEMSGGYRMRAKLLYLIGTEPNLMLLDEPTNYLDLETLLVLERFLQNAPCAFMVISHDREFLRRTTNYTLEVESGEMTKFPGNIDDYFEQKALLRSQLEAQALSQAAKRKEVMDFVARFGAKATKASQAQSRLKMLEKMEKIEVKSLPVSAKIRIPEPQRIGKKAISLENVDLGYEGRTVLKKINFTLVREDKVGVVGFNGVGKSTLLKAIAGVLPPLQGKVELGYGVTVGYYAQHVAEALNSKNRIIDELRAASQKDVREQEIMDMAGSLLFSGDAIYKDVYKLSGGEKARVALAKILLMQVPLLVMDEATNHLDFNTVEALTQALNRYQGTLVLVSHDRGFVRRIATKILEIRDGQVLEYPGNYDDYVWKLSQSQQQAEARKSENNKSTAPKEISHTVINRENRKDLEKKLKQQEKESREIEKRIQSLQEQMSALNERLGQTTGQERTTLLTELGNIPHLIIELEEKWESLLLAQDELNERLKN